MTDEVPAVTATLAQLERWHISRVLEHHKWVKKAAATSLGVARSTLLYKIRQYGIMPRVNPFE